ncbi:MAG: hypothetical protein U0Q12_18850 [Vicinamibacterales bacterium]
MSSEFVFGTANRYAADLEWPIANEYTIEFERQIPGNIVASLGYTRRETRRNIGSRNVAVPLETYIPLAVTEANSSRQVTVYNQAPALRGRSDILWAIATELDANYNGTDITNQHAPEQSLVGHRRRELRNDRRRHGRHR